MVSPCWSPSRDIELVDVVFHSTLTATTTWWRNADASGTAARQPNRDRPNRPLRASDSEINAGKDSMNEWLLLKSFLQLWKAYFIFDQFSFKTRNTKSIKNLK